MDFAYYYYRPMRALSVVFALATALARLKYLPLAQDVAWFTSPERAAWSTAESPSVCVLDAFHFGVQFTAPTRAQYRDQDTFKWQLVANKVGGWENGAVVASGLLKVTLLDSNDPKEEEIGQEMGHNGIKCEFDPQYCTPKLVNIRLPGVDPENEDGPSLKKDHVMELEFQQPTNRPDASSKELIDQLVVFTEYIGDELVGTWTDDGRVLVIQVVQIDEEKVKPVKQLMQGLLRTGLYLKESNVRVDEIGTFEGVQSLRIEPPGTYLIRVLIADEIAFWSPEVSVQPCDASYIVVDPRRASQDISIDASEKIDAIRDTPSFALDGVSTHGGKEGFVLPHDAVRMEMAGSWSLSIWVFLTEDSTGSFRTLFFNGDGRHEQRTPSAWWMPDERRLVLRVSTSSSADVGFDSGEELPLNRWIHMGFTFLNCTGESDVTEESQIPSACPRNQTLEDSWVYSYAFYVNGLLDTEGHIHDPVVANNGPLQIGKGPWTDGMKGFSSNLKIFPVPISSEQMRKMYFAERHIHENHANCESVEIDNVHAAAAAQISYLSQCLKFERDDSGALNDNSVESENQRNIVEFQAAAFEKAVAARESCDSNAWDLVVEAADLGHATACRDVGETYLYGSYVAQEHCPAPVSVQQNVGLAGYFLEKAFNSNALSAGKALALLVDVAGGRNNSEVARFEPFTTGLLHFAAAGGEKDVFAVLGRRYHQDVERSNHGLEIAVYHYYHAAVEAAAEFHQLGKQPLHEMTRLYDSFERDVTVGERGDDDELIQFQKMRADKEGDVGAMAAMGDLYYWGAHGIPRDHAQAYNYFSRAAQAGDVNSQSATAGMLLKGEGTSQDNVTAIKWYEKAAEKNHTRALNGLGFIHFHGSGGVPENKSLALKYFERAAENQEDGDSVFNAGYCHAIGLGTNVNVSRAMEFYDLAARKFGHFDAIFEMGKNFMKGVQGVVPRDTKKALQYLKAASDGGQWGRAVRRGFNLYTNGQFDRAAVSYHEARELGYPVATSNLAFLYDQRLLHSGDVASERRALKYLSLASEENGDRETLVRIGDYHYYGLAGLRKDPQTAIRWYSRASAAGVEAGAYNVGHMYEFGDGVEVNLNRARRYYDRVLELSSGSAEIQLAIRFALARLALRQWLQGTPFETLLGFNSSLGTGTDTNITATDSTSMLDAATRSLDSKIYAIISTAAIIILSIGVWYFHSTG